METILITGGTGMIGSRLSQLLIGRGYGIIILSRAIHSMQGDHPFLRYASWNIETQTIDTDAIAAADYIIHLAGAGVAEKRWTEKRKREIVNSRTESSRLLVKALGDIPNKVRKVVSASAIGWYGPDTAASRSRGFIEDDPADNHFLGETCRLWEKSITDVQQFWKQLVILRTGIVLSGAGGALRELKKPLKAGVAAILGDGQQVVSWIQLDDLCNMYIAAIESSSMNGVYNAVAPQPVTNKILTLELAHAMRGKFFIPVHIPSFGLKMIMGEMSVEVLKSATVCSAKISSTGFRFLYPCIGSALKASI